MAEWADLTEEQRQQAMREIEAQQANEQQARNQQMRDIEKKQFQDEMGQGPQYPGFDSLLDSNGNLKSNYMSTADRGTTFYGNIDELNNRNNKSSENLNNRLSGIQLNKDALQELRRRSMDNGPSAWANIATQQQGIEEATNRDRAATQAASANEAARSDMASQGGMSAGARERLARNSQRDLAGARQDVARGGSTQRLAISAQDDANKTDILKALPGMEVQALQPEFKKAEMQTGLETSNNDAWRQLSESEATRHQAMDESQRQREQQANQFNISNAINQNTLKNVSNLSNYGEQMKQWAAFKQSKAMNTDEGKGGVKGGGKN